MEASHAVEAANNVANMTIEHSSMSVQLIRNDVFQILKMINPFVMMGKNGGVQHIWLGEDDSGLTPNLLTHTCWGISVIGVNSDALACLLDQLSQFRLLILGR